jgi:hypothetical protein
VRGRSSMQCPLPDIHITLGKSSLVQQHIPSCLPALTAHVLPAPSIAMCVHPTAGGVLRPARPEPQNQRRRLRVGAWAIPTSHHPRAARWALAVAAAAATSTLGRDIHLGGRYRANGGAHLVPTHPRRASALGGYLVRTRTRGGGGASGGGGRAGDDTFRGAVGRARHARPRMNSIPPTSPRRRRARVVAPHGAPHAHRAALHVRSERRARYEPQGEGPAERTLRSRRAHAALWVEGRIL